MNNLDKQYTDLLQDILDNGVTKQDRTGTGTLSVFGRTIRHDMKTGFPALTTKKIYFKGVVTELLWFLRGDTNIKYLVDNNCHIWDGDAYQNYLKEMDKQFPNILCFDKEQFIHKIKTDEAFAKQFGDLGPVYGKQWRSWDVHNKWDIDPEQIDQIQNLINDLKTSPDSRRLMVNAYNVGELDQMVLPPCHYGFQVYTRGLTWEEQVQWVLKNTNAEMENPYIVEEIAKESTPTRAISLMFNCRSQDVPLGTPFNISSYALLLEIIAKMVNMVPDELIANMGDCHIYLNQIDGVKEQLKREPYTLPKLVISSKVNFNEGIDEFLDSCSISDFQIEDYRSHPTIKIPLSN
jgi:thymidylate synthase